MYLGPTEKLQLVLAGNITTTALKFNVSYYDVGVKGVKYPFFNGYGSSTNTTDADIVDVSNLRETRIIQSFTLYNTDSVASLATIKKDVAGTDYIIIKALLQSGDTLQYNEGSGWSIIKSSLQESVLFTRYRRRKPLWRWRRWRWCYRLEANSSGRFAINRYRNHWRRRYSGISTIRNIK
jgi:hypothetical protein